MHNRPAIRNKLVQQRVASLQTVHPIASLEREKRARWSRRWRYPSLHAVLHLKMYQDFPLGRRLVRRCQKKGCERNFATDRAKQEYCSQRCKWAARKTRYRTIHAMMLSPSHPRAISSSTSRVIPSRLAETMHAAQGSRPRSGAGSDTGRRNLWLVAVMPSSRGASAVG
jgi:hypothetical protein